MRAPTRWWLYGRCPVCWRRTECRKVGLISWIGPPLKRPHKGRTQMRGK